MMDINHVPIREMLVLFSFNMGSFIFRMEDNGAFADNSIHFTLVCGTQHAEYREIYIDIGSSQESVTLNVYLRCYKNAGYRFSG